MTATSIEVTKSAITIALIILFLLPAFKEFFREFRLFKVFFSYMSSDENKLLILLIRSTSKPFPKLPNKANGKLACVLYRNECL
jgi:hypothetical protein